MKYILFLNEIEKCMYNYAFVGDVPNINGKNELLNNLSKVFYFPDYFGKNWDALNDMLWDFSWIENKTIVIKHNSISGLSDEELRIYLEILLNSCLMWEKNKEHNIIAVFNNNDKNRILKLMSQIPRNE